MLDFTKPNRELDNWIHKELFNKSGQAPKYSSSMYAWQIVSTYFTTEERIKDDWKFDLETHNHEEGKHWFCWWQNDKECFFANAESPSLAICEVGYLARMEGII